MHKPINAIEFLPTLLKNSYIYKLLIITNFKKWQFFKVYTHY